MLNGLLIGIGISTIAFYACMKIVFLPELEMDIADAFIKGYDYRVEEEQEERNEP